MNLFARGQVQLRTDILTLLDDTSNARWTDAQVYTAINQALSMWGGRVLVPHLYQPTDYSWDNNTYEYTLPAWLDGRYITPQMRRVIPYNGYPLTSDGTETWVDIPGFSIEPTTGEGRKLRFQSMPFDVDARILYWTQQPQVFTTLPTFTSNFTSAATTASFSANATNQYPSAAYFKTEDEFFFGTYSTRAAGNITYTVAARGLFSAFTDTANSGTSVQMAVVVPDERLFVQLMDSAMAILHRMRFGLASPEERSVHGQMIQLYQAQADKFWRSWTPNRPIKMRLDRRAL
jgi:hypothetical protein